jgi:hypothetical protein
MHAKSICPEEFIISKLIGIEQKCWKINLSIDTFKDRNYIKWKKDESDTQSAVLDELEAEYSIQPFQWFLYRYLII